MTKDTARRGLRTLGQVTFVAAVVTLAKAFGWIAWTPEQTTAFMAVATPIVGMVQSLLEDSGAIPNLK